MVKLDIHILGNEKEKQKMYFQLNKNIKPHSDIL